MDGRTQIVIMFDLIRKNTVHGANARRLDFRFLSPRGSNQLGWIAEYQFHLYSGLQSRREDAVAEVTSQRDSTATEG